MVGFALSFGIAFVLVWAIIALHEGGHYWAGRRVVGIPADRIKFVDPYLPRYVALKEGNEWVSPAERERYSGAYEQHDPEGEHTERFAAAGDLVQAGVVGPVAMAVGLVIAVDLAVAILLLSLLTTAVYFVVDAAGTLYTGSSAGDYSLLWQADRTFLVLFLLGFASMHVVPLLVLT